MTNVVVPFVLGVCFVFAVLILAAEGASSEPDLEVVIPCLGLAASILAAIFEPLFTFAVPVAVAVAIYALLRREDEK